MRPVRTELDRIVSRRGRADLAVFHEYVPPPSGGGNQFVRALTGELEARGLVVERNRISGGTGACLFNSFNFDFRRLQRFARAEVRMVHRVDGPIGVYRGFDDGTDARIAAINGALAAATVFQSRWSLERHRELGLELRSPTVIHERGRPAGVPSARRSGAARRPPGARRRDELVGQPEEGRRPPRLARPARGSRAVRAHVRGEDASPARAHLASSGPWTRMRLPTCCDGLTSTWRRAATTRARTRSSRRSLAGCRRRSWRAAGTPSSSARRACRSARRRSFPACSTASSTELEERRSAIRVPSLADVADRYLDVLFT